MLFYFRIFFAISISTKWGGESGKSES